MLEFENEKLTVADLHVLAEMLAEEELPNAPKTREGLYDAIICVAETRVGKYAQRMLELLATMNDLESAQRTIRAAMDTADEEGEGTMAASAKKTAAKKAPAAKKAAPPAKAPAAKKAAPVAAKANGNAVSKRSNKYAGMLLRPTKDTNHRRAGTHGHKSMEIIHKAGAKGITTEDFLKAGGRAVDLAWDIEHKHVKTEKQA